MFQIFSYSDLIVSKSKYFNSIFLNLLRHFNIYLWYFKNRILYVNVYTNYISLGNINKYLFWIFLFTVQNIVPSHHKDKVDRLNNILQKEEKDVDELRELARSEGGLVISKQHNTIFYNFIRRYTGQNFKFSFQV